MAGKLFFVIAGFLRGALAFYTLTDEEFASLPPLVHWDRYSPCIGKPGGVYCTASAVVHVDRQNNLYNLMVKYSTSAPRHYNYTHIVYAVCMTDRCKQYYKGNTTSELLTGVEACINDTMLSKYDLKAKVYENHCYNNNDGRHKMDDLDSTAAFCFFTLIALIVVATAYDIGMGKKGEDGLLLSFSLRGNWDRLKEPPTSHPRRSQLKALNGIRFMTTVLVMLGHAPIFPISAPENPQWLEHALQTWYLQCLFQGHTITLTFFVLSGFLLTYNCQMLRETRKMNWLMLPKGILIRWLRLAPVNIALLLLTTTWFRFTAFSPNYYHHIATETRDCRKNWLAHILYFNNYVDDSACHIQNWSMAVDMQLHIVGMTIIFLSPSVKFRNRALLGLFLVGLLLPALETYRLNLDATFLVSAENIRQYFMNDLTFHNTYKRTHTNIPCFVIGMTLGYWVYDWHTGIKQVPAQLKKFLACTTWLLFPMMAAVTCATFILFLNDGPRPPMYQRVLYSILQKPIFGVLLSLVIITTVTKAETIVIYRRILEWPVWAQMSKLTYCMFAVHVTVLRYVEGTKTVTSYLSFPYLFQNYSGVVIISTFYGFILHMTVEAPFGQLVKLLLISGPRSKVKTLENISSKCNGNSVHRNGNIHTNGNTVLYNGNGVCHSENDNYKNGKLMKKGE